MGNAHREVTGQWHKVNEGEVIGFVGEAPALRLDMKFHPLGSSSFSHCCPFAMFNSSRCSNDCAKFGSVILGSSPSPPCPYRVRAAMNEAETRMSLLSLPE